MAWWRKSIGSSQTACPLRWFEIAQTLRPYLFEDVEPALQVVVVLRRPPHVEVLARAGDLEAVVAPLAGVLRHLFECQVGPLPGEERDRMRARELGAGGVRGVSHSCRSHLDPGARLGGVEHRIRDPHGPQTVGEARQPVGVSAADRRIACRRRTR